MKKEHKKAEIENFIIYYTSDDKEREKMYEVLKDYLEYEEDEEEEGFVNES